MVLTAAAPHGYLLPCLYWVIVTEVWRCSYIWSHISTIAECNQLISEVPYTRYAGSSHKSYRSRHSCSAAEGHIHSSSGWCPKRSNGG